MFPSHQAEQRAITFQLTAALDAYEHDLQALFDTPSEAAIYQRLAQHFDQMQMYAASLPQLSVSWVALMISRAELMHALWRDAQDAGAHADGALLLEQHRDAVDALRRRCTRMLRKD